MYLRNFSESEVSCIGLSSVQLLSCVWLFVTPMEYPMGYHTRIPCPSLSPRVCSNLCPLSQWCYPTISSSVAHFSTLNLSQTQGFFQWVGSSHQVAKVLELQLQHSPSNEYLGFISFRTDYCFSLRVQGTLRSLLQHQNLKGSRLLRLRRWRTSKAKLLSEFVKC